MIASLSFETPSALLLALLALIPLAALVAAGRRVERVRAVLGLAEPAGRSARLRALLLLTIPLLLAVAAARPQLRDRSSHRVRTDAAVFVVIDTSSSMSAAASSHAPTRLAQAKQIAIAVASQLPGIPLGVATFTDRVLPNAFPTADAAIFASTVRALTVEDPPPRETSRVATTFTALAALRNADFFTRAETHRALLLITDGESTTFDASSLARTFARAPRVHVAVVRVGGAGDRLHAADGRAGGTYRADPAGARRAVAQLVGATGGASFQGVRQALQPLSGLI